MDHEQDRYLMTSQVARLLGVSGQTIRTWEARGVLRAVKTMGGVRLFALVDVQRLIAERDAEHDSRHESSTVAHA